MTAGTARAPQTDCLLRPGNTNCGGCGMSVAQVAKTLHRSRDEVRMHQLLALRALQHELESRRPQ